MQGSSGVPSRGYKTRSLAVVANNAGEPGPDGAYSEGEVVSLQLVWGSGYLSPGGAAAVARILSDTDISGKDVLDLGCGIGGPTVELVRSHGARHVLGVDVNQNNLKRAEQYAREAGLQDRISFLLADPGGLPLEDQSVDVVFSKDALVEAPDKSQLFAEAFRVLRRGGWLAASDWLRADGPVSAILQHWIDFSGSQESPHSFHLASLSETRETLRQTGFKDVEIKTENVWYREEARRELSLKTGPLWPQFVALRGEQDATQSVEWHRAMIAALDGGDFCPSTFRARKPQ
jgi:phosphoethanolamine N-methyltransferase